MKKLAAIAVMMLMLLVCACDGKADPGSTGTESTAGDNAQVENVTDTVIVSAGASEYKLLRADTESGGTTDAAIDLRAAIKETAGVELAIITDWVKRGDPEIQIDKMLVLGQVNNAAARGIYESLGENDYTVRELDGSVYIVGGSEAATYYAYLKFAEEFIGGGTLSVPDGYTYLFEGADSREDYIADPDLFLVNWIDEFVPPEWMCDYSELLSSLAAPGGRMMSSAHRGDFRNYPENSIEGIISCIKMGCDNIELDLRLTKDGVVVLMHDETLSRTTNFSSMAGRDGLPTSDKLSDWTYAELQKLDLQMNGGEKTPYKIPTFEEALTVCRGRITIRVDKMTGLDSWIKYVWPAMLKCEATQTCILNYHIDLSSAVAILKRWSSETDGKTPYYFGKINNSNRANWSTYDRTLTSNGLMPFVRWSDFNPDSNLVSAVDNYKADLARIGGKLRIYVDAHQNSAQETPEMWDMLLENGVNFILVNDPLKLCKYIAERYGNDWSPAGQSGK